MKIIYAVAACALVAQLALQGAAPSRAQAVTWGDAVGQLAGERTRAERCIAILKKYGNDAQRDRGDLSYADAKADSDTVIAGLKTALSEESTPANLPSLPSLLTKLKSSESGLIKFCDEVKELIPSKAPGQKGVFDNIAKVTIEQLVKPLSDAISALYVNHRNDKALTRAEIKADLDGARWPEFAKVSAAP
jgi:hypothetical protein